MNRPLSVAVLLSLAACINVVSPGESEKLREAERRWEQTGIDDYIFEMRTSCFCPPEMHEWAVVEVRDGVIVSATRLDGTPFTDWGLTSRKTVAELFEEAHARYDWLADIDFEFDDTYGYPLTIQHKSKRNIADAGATYEARNLVPTNLDVND